MQERTSIVTSPSEADSIVNQYFAEPAVEKDSASKRISIPATQVSKYTDDNTNIGRSRGKSQELTPWLDYLVKNREKSSSVDGLATIAESSSKPSLPKRVSSIYEERSSNISLNRKSYHTAQEQIGDRVQVERRVLSMGSADPLEEWKKSLDQGLSKLDSAVDPSINAFQQTTSTKALGWNVKVYESHALTTDIPEYKTIFVHPESTVLDLLALSLKKWKCINLKLVSDILAKGPKAILSQELQDFIAHEGWQLLLVTSDKDKFQVENAPLSPSVKVASIINAAPQDLQPSFTFRKMLANADSLVSDYLRSSSFEPLYLYKLNSSYPQTLLNEASSPEIDIKHWTRRYVLVARNRYMLFFKSENHSKWRQNLLHEIDLAKTVAIEAFLGVCIGENGQPRAYGIRIKTRTRAIYLCLDTEAERSCVVKSLEDIRRSCLAKRSSQPNTKLQQLKDGNRQNSVSSLSSSPDQAHQSPMQQLVMHIEQRNFLNDIDLPPADQNNRQAWAMATNVSLFNTLRELVVSKLLYLVDNNDLQEFGEQMKPVFKDVGILDGNRVMSSSKNEGSPNVMNTMKKMFKGWNASPASSTSTASLQTQVSMLFGVSLDELSMRYDSSNSGIPTLPPIVNLSIGFTQEKGMHAGGLFRIAGSVKRMELLKKAFEKADMEQFQKITQPHSTIAVVQNKYQTDSQVSLQSSTSSTSQSENIDFTPYNVHDVAGVFKWFLRDLPDPILTSKLYRAFMAIDKVKDAQLYFKLLHHLVMLLPAINRHMLYLLLKFMHSIQKFAEDVPVQEGIVPPLTATVENGFIKGNLMNSSNLAVVMGPNILREVGAKSDDQKKDSNASKSPRRNSVYDVNQDSQQDISDSTAVVNIIKVMIDRYDELFIIPAELLTELKAVSGSSHRTLTMRASPAPLETKRVQI